MKAKFKIHDRKVKIDVSKPLDISIPLKGSWENPIAWHLDVPQMVPVEMDDWVGKVSEGASVNFNTITFNPHAHGTHTECVGHISKEFHSVNKALQKYFFLAELISVTPREVGADFVITKEDLQFILDGKRIDSLVIRTLPNSIQKKTKNYSNTNWPFFDENAMIYIREIGVKHLLVDLPSVDKEKDDGKLLAHKAFWNYPKSPRYNATITEFIYVPNKVKDGSYLLNLQIAPFCNDASPSKPVLYKIK